MRIRQKFLLNDPCNSNTTYAKYREDICPYSDQESLGIVINEERENLRYFHFPSNLVPRFRLSLKSSYSS